MDSRVTYAHQGIAGPIRGSPFTCICEEGADPENNTLNGPLMMSSIKDTTRELKDYSTKTLKGLKKVRMTAARYPPTVSCVACYAKNSRSCSILILESIGSQIRLRNLAVW